jgi:Reverse transcriptase (RNA-dependent DNA polymerase)
VITEGSYFHIIRHKGHILLDPSHRKQRMENGISYAVRILRVLNNTVRANQYSSNLPKDQPRYITAIPNKIYICYLDNILVYSEDKEQYVTYIKQVLEVLIEKEFRLKLSKYNFYTKEIVFLGYVIILRKISLDPKKIRVITT